ncbi:hypothetical protein ACHAXS_012117 [Conticribra weissflogii]
MMRAKNTTADTKEKPSRCSAVNHSRDYFPGQSSKSFPFSRNDSLQNGKSLHLKALSLMFILSLPNAIEGSDSSKRINRCPLRHSSTISRPPLILGHRGASFHLPEHSLPSYRLALELGADYIEPDLVPTSDNVLVALHHVDLNLTTNVHTYNNGQFTSRARQAPSNNDEWGYYVHDFTWDELQLLSVRQRFKESGARSEYFDDLFGIPSFSQIVSLLHDWNTRELPLIGRPSEKTGGVPGLYVELKRSQFFQEDANISLAEMFLDELANHPKASELLFDHVTLCEGLRYDEYRVPPLVIQSFEGDILEYLRGRFKERWMDFVEEDALLSSLPSSPTWNDDSTDNSTGVEDDEVDHPWIPPLVLLVDLTTCQSTEFWFEVGKLHIQGLGPAKECLLPSPSDIQSGNTMYIDRAKRLASEWVAKAHSIHGLAVHPWTVRLEMERHGSAGGVPEIFSSAEEELRYYFCDLKVDGIFTENIAAATIVGAEGCDDAIKDDVKSQEAAEWPQVGKGGPVCVKEERSLWFFGLAFGAIGAFVGSVMTCYLSGLLHKRGYCGGVMPDQALSPVEVITTTTEDGIDDESEML